MRTDGQSEPVNLSHVTGNAHDWPSNRITPDSTRVVISMSVDGVGPYELYSVPITGGPLVKLNGPLVAGGNVGQYVISDDSAWAVSYTHLDVYKRQGLCGMNWRAGSSRPHQITIYML